MKRKAVKSGLQNDCSVESAATTNFHPASSTNEENDRAMSMIGSPSLSDIGISPHAILNLDPMMTDFFESFEPTNLFSALEGDFCPLDDIVPRPAEFSEMNYHLPNNDEELAMIADNDLSLPTTQGTSERSPSEQITEISIFLSQSVAVTITPTLEPIRIVYPLEETYRARYKSDYFPQSGQVRRPRYVADTVGNHCVTLEIPASHRRNYLNAYIRVALITMNIDGQGHFYSPYNFQVDHQDGKVPDVNPMYLPMKKTAMKELVDKFQLVLIKSKLDQLNYAQPLRRFIDHSDAIRNIIDERKLSPKDLINQYQLDKSHIAFTLCTKQADGSFNIHSETTAISSIITEACMKQPVPLGIVPKESAVALPENDAPIRCPCCHNSFRVSDLTPVKDSPKGKSNKRQPSAPSEATTNNRSNKRKKVAS